MTKNVAKDQDENVTGKKEARLSEQTKTSQNDSYQETKTAQNDSYRWATNTGSQPSPSSRAGTQCQAKSKAKVLDIHMATTT